LFVVIFETKAFSSVGLNFAMYSNHSNLIDWKFPIDYNSLISMSSK